MDIGIGGDDGDHCFVVEVSGDIGKVTEEENTNDECTPRGTTR